MDGIERIQRWWMQTMFPAGAERPRALGSAPGRTVRMLLLVALFGLTGVLFLARLDHPLLEPEEGRYAEIPRQMLVRGHFVTPILHGEDYWQKPPLLYWLVMACYRVFGVHDWSARLVPSAAGIACVVITTGWGWRVLGFWTGFLGGAILALSVRFLYLAGMLTMDGLLCASVIAGLAAGHLALVESTRRRRWLVLSAIACALGVLTKGPVAVVLIAAPLLAFVVLDRRRRLPTIGAMGGYVAIVGLLAGPWFAIMALQAPAAAGTFFWLHNLNRYFAPFDHEKPAWFYLPSLLLGMLPWTLLLIPLVRYLGGMAPRACSRRPAALGLFLLAFAWCVLFFSASGCKRPAYILPAFPLLALVLATLLTHGMPWRRWMHTPLPHRPGHRLARRLTMTTCCMGLAVSAAVAVANLCPWGEMLLPSLMFGFLGIAAIIWPARRPTWNSWAGVVAVMLVFLGCGQRVWLPAYHERFGLRQQVEISAEYEQNEPFPIMSFPKRWDSISFYTQREDVESYAPADQARLIRDLKTHGKALLFVRRETSLANLLAVLPADLEIELCEHQGNAVVVCVVRRRPLK